ncbi:hypothetical protein M1N19_03025 [Dehalococcoidia bacterium]|nr:hypothetical protein [Dehalococcoidia bacterium]MCL0039238.1 hypothetical protein [Dehalococcoidia bacterium]
MIKGKELLKMLLARGLIKLDIEKGKPLLRADQGIYVEIEEDQIKRGCP